ncbi:MAG: hypothetical protein HY981_00090 [Candidatus Magasanikbacteria bacterium]|nr:hypothetical protein [Candidatus Magasanikbacteria bacterium]
MTLKQYFLALGIGVFFAFLSLVVIILQVNPINNPFWGPSLFYTSFFFTVSGLYAMGGFVWRVRVLKQTDIAFRQVKKTFRQGCLFAAVSAMALMLQHARILRWWSILILIISALWIEMNALSKEEKHHSRPSGLPPLS